MNKKGFTLVELLGVIVILSILVLISIPIINSIVNDSKKQIKETNVITILDAAYSWAMDDELNIELPENENESITVTLDTIKKSGHLKKEVINAETGTAYNDNCVITITKKKYNKSEADTNDTNANNKYYNNYLFELGC